MTFPIGNAHFFALSVYAAFVACNLTVFLLTIMKYLLISDIHGCRPALEKALAFGDAQGCEIILIIGDILNYGPRNRIPEGIDAPGIVAILNERADKIVAVRGNCDAEVDQMLLKFPCLADYALLVDEGKRFILTHGHKYSEDNLPPGRYDMVVTGHTHLWKLCQKNGTAYLNTGSITFPKGGNPPTMATYEAGVVSVFTLDGERLAQIKLLKFPTLK